MNIFYKNYNITLTQKRGIKTVNMVSLTTDNWRFFLLLFNVLLMFWCFFATIFRFSSMVNKWLQPTQPKISSSQALQLNFFWRSLKLKPLWHSKDFYSVSNCHFLFSMETQRDNVVNYNFYSTLPACRSTDWFPAQYSIESFPKDSSMMQHVKIFANV